MFSRLFGSILIAGILYGMLVFVAPDLADQYGNRDINAKIREYKDKSLHFASGSSASGTLFDNIKWTATSYLDETKKNIEWFQITVNTKVSQVQEVWLAIESAYSGVMDAKRKIQNLSGSGK